MVQARRKGTVAVLLWCLSFSVALQAVAGEVGDPFEGDRRNARAAPILAGRSGDVAVERSGRIRQFSVRDNRAVQTWDVFRTGEGRVSFTVGDVGFVLGEEATAAFDGRVLRLVHGTVEISSGMSVFSGAIAAAGGDTHGGTPQQVGLIAGEVLLEISPTTVGVVERRKNGSVAVSVSAGRIDFVDTRGRELVVEPGTVGVLDAPSEAVSLRETDEVPGEAVSRAVADVDTSILPFQRVLFIETRAAFEQRFETVRGERGTTDELKRGDGRISLPEQPVGDDVADAAFEAAVLSLELERMTALLREQDGVVEPGASALLGRRGRALRYTSRLVQ